MVNRIKQVAEGEARQAEAATPSGPTELEVLLEIRDALKQR
jgi:large conductance mechanosensitive channel